MSTETEMTTAEKKREARRLYRLRFPEKIREYQRRYKKGAAGKAARKRYMQKESTKVLHRQQQSAQRKKWPEKTRARRKLGKALKSGKVQRQRCEHCSRIGEAHHDDYTKPLEVRWLCALHHKAEHPKKGGE